MNAPRFHLVLAVLAVMGAGPASAEVAAYERGIMERVSATYRTLGRYYLSGRIEFTTESAGRRDTLVASVVMAGVRPDRMREELRHATEGFQQVSDGKHLWIYYPGMGQYTVREGTGPDIGDAESGGGAGLRAGLTGSVLAHYRGIGLTIESAVLRRTEYLRFDGSDRECWVLEASYPASGEASTKEFWIDRERFLVLKHRIRFEPSPSEGAVRVETLVYDRIQLNEPVADDVFRFAIPAGAKQVRSFGPETADLTGKAASEFVLADLSGKRHSLAAQRGKVVLLDFWATWCGPCRTQMPIVDRIYRELRGQGLVVFAVNQREGADVAREYMRKAGYTTTTLLDAKGEVGDLYQVYGIPTLVVIDRQGRIAAHLVGVRPEADVRDALAKAGLR